jgi:histidine phosphotransferase ChpT
MAETPLSDPVSLAQLLCTRLCHDLAGPIGAVAAGVELTAGDPSEVDAETLGLIGSSSAAASRKLKFLRTALGLPSAGVPTDLSALVRGFLEATAGRSGAPALAWPPADAVAQLSALGPDAVPLLLNLCLLVHEAMPVCTGLTVSVAMTPAKAISVAGVGDGQRASAWRPDILEAIASRGSPTAKTVQAHFVALLATRCGGRVSLEAGPSGLSARCELSQ